MFQKASTIERLVRGMKKRIENVVVVGGGVAGLTVTAALQELRRMQVTTMGPEDCYIKQVLTLEALSREEILSDEKVNSLNYNLYTPSCTALWRSLCLHHEMFQTKPYFHPGWLIVNR